MYAFEMHKADSLANAAALLAKSGGKPLAGGQSLVAAMKMRLAVPGALVDLSGVPEMKGIRKEGIRRQPDRRLLSGRGVGSGCHDRHQQAQNRRR